MELHNLIVRAAQNATRPPAMAEAIACDPTLAALNASLAVARTQAADTAAAIARLERHLASLQRDSATANARQQELVQAITRRLVELGVRDVPDEEAKRKRQ